MAQREAPKRVAEGISKRGGRYIVRVYDPETRKTKWHTLPEGTTLPQAKKAKRELEEAKRQVKTAQSETVAEWAARWNDSFPGRKESTIRHNTERIKAFVTDFGSRPLASISPKEARLWATGGACPLDLYDTARHWKDAEERDGTLIVPDHRHNIPAVRVLMGDAQRAGITPANPFGNLRLKQSSGRRHITVLTAEEVSRLAQTAKVVHGEFGEHLADLVLIAAWAGLRPGELRALIPERVDLKAGILTVVESADGKTGRVWETKTEHGSRVIPLLPEARKPLERVLAAREAGEFLFQPPRPRTRFHRQGRASLSAVTLNYWWSGVRDAFAAGLDEQHWLRRRIKGEQGKLTLYELRHACGTRLAERGVSAEDIAQFLGHADGGVLALQTYVHVAREFSAQRIRGAFEAA